MPTPKDSRNTINLLKVSIRIQQSRRAKREEDPERYTRLLQEMESNLSLVLEMQELSRQKLARNLHDGLTQTVATLSMRVNFARRLMETNPEKAKLELHKIEELTRRTAKDIRHMIFILRRVDITSHGLEGELEGLLDKMDELFDLKVYLSIESALVEDLTNYKQGILYSIIEEGIDNARKYAEAEQVWVRLKQTKPELVLLEIEHDGRFESQDGQDNNIKHLDRMKMYARFVNGSVKAKPIEGKSSIIQVFIPINALTTQETSPGQ